MNKHCIVSILWVFFQFGCKATSTYEVETEIRTVGPFVVKSPELVIVYSDDELKDYVDSVNAELHFLFSYTRSLNMIAKSRGVVPVFNKPICEFVEWGKLRDPPDFKFSKNATTLEKLNVELVEYIKLTKELYRLHTEEFKNLEALAREMCTY